MSVLLGNEVPVWGNKVQQDLSMHMLINPSMSSDHTTTMMRTPTFGIQPPRILQDENEESSTTNTGFIPSFEGYLTLELSLLLDNYSNDVVSLTQYNNDEVEGRLDSLILFFLCSRDIDVVFSPNPDELLSVCPFEDTNDEEEKEDKEDEEENSENEEDGDNVIILDDGDQNDNEEEEDGGGNRYRRQLKSFLEGMGIQWRRMLKDPFGKRKTLVVDINDPTSMILWNVPKIEQDIILLGGSGMADDEAEEYYTHWKFTYPVYNWGPLFEQEDGLYDEERVQFLLDDNIESGTFGSLLPWEDAQLSIVGQELRTFANITLPDDDDATYSNSSLYDNEIPHDKAKLLQGLGSSLVIVNAIFVILMTILAKRHRIQKEKDAEQQKLINADNGNNTGGGLGTEQGVSEMLMESKMFAIGKSQEFRNSMVTRPRPSTSFHDTDPSAPVNLSTSPSSSRKERELLNEATGHKKKFNGQLLANLSMDSEDQEDNVDFKPPSPARKQHSVRRKKSRRKREVEEC